MAISVSLSLFQCRMIVDLFAAEPWLVLLLSLTLGLCDGYTSLVRLAGVTAYFPVHDSLTLQKWSLYLSGGGMARSAIAVSADGSRAASVSTLTQLGETMRRGPCIYSVKWRRGRVKWYLLYSRMVTRVTVMQKWALNEKQEECWRERRWKSFSSLIGI